LLLEFGFFELDIGDIMLSSLQIIDIPNNRIGDVIAILSSRDLQREIKFLFASDDTGIVTRAFV
jgi:hypothetical protein